MQKVVSIFLIIVLLCQSAGHFIFFKIKQFEIRTEIKHRIKSGLADDDLTLLKIPNLLISSPNLQFQWIHKGEFRFEEKLFDIVNTEKRGSETWFYCIDDHDETLLFANLDILVKNEMKKNRDQRKGHDIHQRLLVPVEFDKSGYCQAIGSTYTKVLSKYQFITKTWTSKPDLPPPKV